MAAIPLYALVSFAIFHRSATGLPRSSHRFSEAFHRGLPGIFRTSARNLPEVCQKPSGGLPGTFRRSARQASGRPRNDGDLPEVCQHPSLVFPTVFLTRCLPWEGGSARAWQTSGRFLADPPEGTFRWQRGLLLSADLLVPFRDYSWTKAVALSFLTTDLLPTKGVKQQKRKETGKEKETR